MSTDISSTHKYIYKHGHRVLCACMDTTFIRRREEKSRKRGERKKMLDKNRKHERKKIIHNIFDHFVDFLVILAILVIQLEILAVRWIWSQRWTAIINSRWMHNFYFFFIFMCFFLVENKNKRQFIRPN